jgi:hypothetical protein
MNIAMFVETYEPSMEDKKRQTLIVPIDGTTKVYSRTTDGTAGKHNRWEETSLPVLLNTTMSSNEYITVKPLGIHVTAADEQAIRENGWSPVLSTKAMSAYENAEKDEEFGSVAQRITSLHDQVSSNDTSLEAQVIDLRRQRDSQEETPFIASPTQTIAADAVQADVVIEDVEYEEVNSSGKLKIALASIPPIEAADKYINRNLTGGVLDFDVFDYARANKREVLIYGPTGPGKTTSVIAWAAKNRLRLAAVSGNAALEPSQLIGKYVPDGKGGFEWIDGPVTDVVRNGGVLILDELNFISPKIYTILYSLIDGRRCLILLDHHGETIQAHPDLTVFATMNPDYIGTTPLNFAMRNRFTIQIPWDYDDEVEAKLVKSKAILTIAKQLRSESAKGEIDTPISTNMLMELEEIVQFNYEFAIANFVAHFDKEEQEKVALVLMTHEYNIKSDFGLHKDEANTATDPAVETIGEEVDAWLKSNNK